MISNCLLKALQEKCKHPKNKIYIAIPKDKTERGIPHFIWNDGINFYHFCYIAKTGMNHWYKFFLFKGEIKKYPHKYLKYVDIKRVM